MSIQVQANHCYFKSKLISFIILNYAFDLVKYINHENRIMGNESWEMNHEKKIMGNESWEMNHGLIIH